MSEENKEIEELKADVQPELEKLVADDVAETREKPTQNHRLTTTNILVICITLAVIALLAVMYLRAFPPAVQPTESDSSETAVEPTPLPTELTDFESVTVLVNKNHPLPADYVPNNLVTPYVNSTSDVIQVNQLAEDALRKMLKAAEKAKVNVILNAGYISYATQNDYYEDRVSLVGQAEASKLMPAAGFNEHQTGLAFDFTDSSETVLNTVEFGDTDAGKWLYENAYYYGFILRYPKGKEDITGYEYQPWHYRYVGEDVANAMHEIDPDLTMEEYFEVNE